MPAEAVIDVSVDAPAGVETDVLPEEPVEAPTVMPAALATDDSHCDDVAAKQVVPCCQFDAGDDDNDNDFVDVQFVSYR